MFKGKPYHIHKKVELASEDQKRKEEEKAERQKPFEEVRDSVESSAEQDKRDKLLESWLSNLRDKAQVKVHEDLIQVPGISDKLAGEIHTFFHVNKTLRAIFLYKAFQVGPFNLLNNRGCTIKTERPYRCVSGADP